MLLLFIHPSPHRIIYLFIHYLFIYLYSTRVHNVSRIFWKFIDCIIFSIPPAPADGHVPFPLRHNGARRHRPGTGRKHTNPGIRLRGGGYTDKKRGEIPFWTSLFWNSRIWRNVVCLRLFTELNDNMQWCVIRDFLPLRYLSPSVTIKEPLFASVFVFAILQFHFSSQTVINICCGRFWWILCVAYFYFFRIHFHSRSLFFIFNRLTLVLRSFFWVFIPPGHAVLINANDDSLTLTAHQKSLVFHGIVPTLTL